MGSAIFARKPWICSCVFLTHGSCHLKKIMQLMKLNHSDHWSWFVNGVLRKQCVFILGKLQILLMEVFPASKFGQWFQIFQVPYRDSSIFLLDEPPHIDSFQETNMNSKNPPPTPPPPPPKKKKTSSLRYKGPFFRWNYIGCWKKSRGQLLDFPHTPSGWDTIDSSSKFFSGLTSSLPHSGNSGLTGMSMKNQ